MDGWGVSGVMGLPPIVVDAQEQAGEQLDRIASEVGAGLIVAERTVIPD